MHFVSKQYGNQLIFLNSKYQISNKMKINGFHWRSATEYLVLEKSMQCGDNKVGEREKTSIFQKATSTCT